VRATIGITAIAVSELLEQPLRQVHEAEELLLSAAVPAIVAASVAGAGNGKVEPARARREGMYKTGDGRPFRVCVCACVVKKGREENRSECHGRSANAGISRERGGERET